MPEIISLEPEFYPIERLLIAGPAADVVPMADHARQAGHSPTLLLSNQEATEIKTSYPVLDAEEPVSDEEFVVAVELHCVDLQAKAEMLYALEDILGESVPILSLTMAISTSELGRELLMPERLVGVSMLPPFADCSLAEIMPSLATDKITIRTAERFFESLNLKTERVADSPGGVLVRTVCCLINEAAFALQDRIATAEEIDKAMLLGVNYPAGPLAWGDKIGLDKVVAVMDGLFAEFKEERYRATPLLRRLVRAGIGFHERT
jgi:3-hydroxybutyryl-CoA dehydrogenase